MAFETILYVSDQATSSNSVCVALKAAGVDVVSTNSSTQAIALLFVMQSVAAVVLHQRTKEQAGSEVARSLRAICPEVPIILLGCDQIAPLPSCVNACGSTGQPLEKLTRAVRHMLNAKWSSTAVPVSNHRDTRRKR
jgi:DNA-binding NtrC family response regulator